MTDHSSARIVAPIIITVEDAPGGYYQGYQVRLNGVPLWVRPYDGESWNQAAVEVTEALCEVLRAHTGRTRAEEDDDDD